LEALPVVPPPPIIYVYDVCPVVPSFDDAIVDAPVVDVPVDAAKA